MRSRKPLKAKTSLRATAGLRSRSKPKKQPKITLTQLRKKADKLYAKAIRLRDSELVDGAWQGQCITCDRICLVVDANGKWQKSNGWGHLIGRGCFYLRYDPENVNLQCSHCNAWRDKDSMLDAYKLAVDEKYGAGTYRRLKEDSIIYKDFRPSVEFFKEVIANATEEMRFYMEDYPVQ